MYSLYAYLLMAVVVLIIVYLLRIVKNVILLSIFTAVSAWLVHKYIYTPLAIDLQSMILYLLFVVGIYIILEILNILFSIYDLISTLLNILIYIFLIPFKLIKYIFFTKSEKGKNKSKKEE